MCERRGKERGILCGDAVVKERERESGRERRERGREWKRERRRRETRRTQNYEEEVTLDGEKDLEERTRGERKGY
jgi:hypothetical protein